MERKPGPGETIDGEDILRFAENLIEHHDFEKCNDDENVWFSYHYSRWLAEVFGRGDLGVYASEVRGAAMPDSIKPLLHREWKHGPYYLDYNDLRLVQDNDFDYVPPAIPGWEEMINEKLSFDEMLERIKTNPDTLAQIKFPKIHCYDGVKVSLRNWAAKEDFGLEFKLRHNGIKVFPFGGQGGTESVTNYVLSNMGRPRVLAKTAAALSLRTVSESYNIKIPVHGDRIEQLKRRLEGIEAITPAHMENLPSPGGLKELAIEQLVESRVLKKP